jgi:hypothetical protein
MELKTLTLTHMAQDQFRVEDHVFGKVDVLHENPPELLGSWNSRQLKSLPTV